MANYTANYNLKKPLGNENYDVENQNANMEIIDGEFKKVNDKVDAIKVPSNPSDIGAETPTGAQEKANTAETNAKAYTDTKIELVNASLDNIVKSKGQPNGLATLDANGKLVQELANKPYIYGTYTGTGATRTISLGFTPSVVICGIKNGVRTVIAIDGYPVTGDLEVVEGGFKVTGNFMGSDSSLNPYRYIAYR